MSKKIIIGLIIIAGLVAIYLTVRPYMYVQRVERQAFFAHDTEEIDKKIASGTDYFSLGVLHAKKQDFQKAKGYFIKTIRRNPGHAGAFNNLGNIAFLEGDPGRARALFHKAVRAEPDNVDYLINFAYACFKVNVIEEAMEAVEKALSIEPENSRARLLRRQMTQ